MASEPGVVVTLDGQLHDPQTPLLHADDLAVVRGDGIFESLLVRDGRPCLLEAHLGRLTQSARLMDLPEPDLPRWRAAVATAASAWTEQGGEEGVLRLVYSRGRESGSPPTAFAMIGALAGRVAVVRKDGVAAVTLARGLPADGATDMPWLLAGAKTLSYAVNMAALRHAERQGAGDVIFVSSDGYILEGPRSTVVIATESNGAGVSRCSPRRRGIRSCAAPPSRRCSRWPATRATTATTARCGPLIFLRRKGFGWYRASRSRRGCTRWTASRCASPFAAEIAELVDAAIVSDR